jgi:hypothetical protein
LEEALRLYEEALGVHHGMNDVHSVAHVLARIAKILSAQGDFAGALDCLGKAEEIFAHLQSPSVEWVRQLTQPPNRRAFTCCGGGGSSTAHSSSETRNPVVVRLFGVRFRVLFSGAGFFVTVFITWFYRKSGYSDRLLT